MTNYFKKRLNDYWQKKSWFTKITDLLLVVLVIAMLIPASRQVIRMTASRLFASSPKTIAEERQQIVSPSTYNWVFYDLDGNDVSYADFRGKAVFLNFWATWCAPCIAEMPDIQDLYDQFGDQAAFLLVSDEKPERIQAFMERRGFDMPVYIRRGGVPADFSAGSIPVTFVISPEGQIVIRKTGVAKWNSDNMQELMRELISRAS